MASEARLCHLSRGKTAPRAPDQIIAELAARQHGVVARGQLLAAGVGRRAIDGRIARGLLHPLHRGVFAVGHRRVSRDGWWMAAVLAGGERAVLSHRSAAALWRMRDTGRTPEVTVARHRGSRPGVQYHEAVLPPDELTVERGIPVTTPARTLLDLATIVTHAQLEHAFHEAEVLRLTSPTSLDALLERYAGRRGTQAIKRLLVDHHKNGQAVPTSVLERRFLGLLGAQNLPRPTINPLSDHGELDARWHDQRLIVECDGFATHGTREAFERDRAKDRALQVAGWRVVRITWRQLTDDPDTIAAQLKALLAAGYAVRRRSVAAPSASASTIAPESTTTSSVPRAPSVPSTARRCSES